MIKEYELVVIGAGPAGMEAAITAAESGAEVLLIDSAPRPGGQYFQQLPQSFQDADPDQNASKGQRLFNRLRSAPVRVLINTLVWGIFEGAQPDSWLVTLHGPEAPHRISARAVILATGAFDRSIPFPGWDLPGVITAGAALRMLKNQRILPGKRFILAGTGPLQLQTAANLVLAGGEVAAVCESAPSLLWRGIPYLPALWGQWNRITEGAGYLKTLLRNRVPYRLGWTITSAQGGDRVNQVKIQKLAGDGRPVSPPVSILDIDSVVVGFGLTPQTELCRMLGCQLVYQERRGGYVPVRDDQMQTSRPGIYAVGDGAGICGAANAQLEGQIAGQAASARLGYRSEKSTRLQTANIRKALRREGRFGQMLGSLFSLPAGLYGLADQDTIVCRCEQVTLGEIREAIAFGAQSVIDIKNIARTGMGNCQGRTCGTIIAQILAAENDQSVEASRYLNIRPPVHPVPLQVIEEHDRQEDGLIGERAENG